MELHIYRPFLSPLIHFVIELSPVYDWNQPRFVMTISNKVKYLCILAVNLSFSWGSVFIPESWLSCVPYFDNRKIISFHIHHILLSQQGAIYHSISLSHTILTSFKLQDSKCCWDKLPHSWCGNVFVCPVCLSIYL